MGSKWQSTSLKELGVRLLDCDHKTPKAVECGIPYIGIPQMDNGRINFDANPRLISEDDFKHWTRKANPMYGDIILSRRCNSGETVCVPRNSKFALGQNLVLLRPEGERVHPEYLRWAVHGKEWWNEVAKYLNPGAIFESLKCADIPKFKIPEPPISAQIKIAEHLSAISGKIELNQKINQTLEQMAQALFKSWFVDFDPVFDNLLASVDFNLENLETSLPDELIQKAQRRLAALNSLENAAECKASLSALAHELQAQTHAAVQVSEKAAETPVKANVSANPNILTQHANTHAHFPNEFEHNEQLGWIPKGWEGGCLEDMLVLQRGFDLPKSKRTNGNYPLIVSSGQDGTHSEFKAKGPGVVTGRSGKIGIITFVHDDFWPLNTTLWIKEYRKSNPYHAFHLLSTLGLEQFNSGSAVPTLNRNHIHSLPLVVPTILVLNEYESYVEGLFLKIRKNNNQSKTLKNLRDTLLPKLISGELQIPDVASDEEVVD